MNRQTTLLKLIIASINENFGKEVIYISPRLSKSLYSYFYILDDLLLVKQYALKIKAIINHLEKSGDRSDEFIADGLWHGIIAMYGRCFTKAGSGFVKLENSVFNSKIECREVHEKLMDIRHKFVAHRDDTFMLESAMTLVIDKEKLNDVRVIVNSQRTRFSESDIDKYLELFEYLIEEVSGLAENQKEKVIKNIKISGPEVIIKESIDEIERLFDGAGDDLKLIMEDIKRIATNSTVLRDLNN